MPKRIVTMMRLKYSLVVVTFVSWFFAAVFTTNGSNLRLAVSAVAAACLLALLFLALSAFVRRRWNEELTFELHWKFLLWAPTSLAAAASAAITVDRVWYSNLCPDVFDCLSLYIVDFAIGLIEISMMFYAIIGVAALSIRLVQMTENFLR
jgi:hypothetical protein